MFIAHYLLNVFWKLLLIGAILEATLEHGLPRGCNFLGAVRASGGGLWDLRTNCACTALLIGDKGPISAEEASVLMHGCAIFANCIAW